MSYLDKYAEEQHKVVSMLKNQIKNKNFSHAYLFVENGYIDTKKLIKQFIKEIISLQSDVDMKFIESTIDNNSFTDIKEIKADGLFIKKDQILELQNEFKTTALENQNKFYIIDGVENFNASSANTILKFLEEPEKNIIAFLITDNLNSVIETISSRCSIINLSNSSVRKDLLKERIADILFKNEEERIEFIENFEKSGVFDGVIKFISHYEVNKIETLFHTNKLFHDILKEKKDYLTFIEILIIIFGDMLVGNIDEEKIIFEEYLELYKELSYANDKIMKFISIFTKTKEKIKGNANLKLAIDSMIIDLCGVENV